MLTIRREQMKLFELVAVRNFENVMMSHATDSWPQHCKSIGQKNLRQVISKGIKQAGSYGLTKKGPVRLYIELMFTFGSDFDTDVQIPWAADSLNDQSVEDQIEKTVLLQQNTLNYIEQAAGPANTFNLKAFQTISQMAADNSLFLLQANGLFEDKMVAKLVQIHPEKCDYVGKADLRLLIQGSLEQARKYGLNTELGAILLTLLMFTLGHGCATDPLYPWISNTLDRGQDDDPGKRVQVLAGKSRAYLDKVLTD